jgi:arabinogalactan oligomer/maltooligosaccharide transport system substrate-binding protein
MQLALFEAGQRPPALQSALDTVSADDADIEAWSAAGEGASPMPNIPAMNAVWAPLGQATADIVSGDDPAERLQAAQEEIEGNLE